MTAHSSLISLRRTALALCLAAALPTLVVGASGPKDTHGVGIVVQNRDASGPGSLRDAVDNAQADSVIDLSGLECPNGEIRLTTASGGAIATAVPGLEVIGPGATALTIHGDDSNLVFRTLFAGLSITDLTIAHGVNADGFGGCLFVGGDLTLTRSVVTGCRAGDGSNDKSYGGGADVLGNLVMEDSTISGSTSVASDNAYGGGVYAQGTVVLRASTISGNTAAAASTYARGGGIAAQGYVSILDRSRLTGNSATTNAGWSQGGALFTNGTAAVKNRSVISYNVSTSVAFRSDGGGVVSAGVEIEKSSIEANTASSDCNCLVLGGGILSFGSITTTYSSIVRNSAEGSYAEGGGMATYSPGESGAILIVNSTISGNRAVGTVAAAGGGAIALSGSPFTVANSTIAFNEATTFGGGLAGADTATIHPSLVNSIVAMNTAYDGADIDSANHVDLFTIEGSNNIVMSTNHVDFVAAPSTEDPKLVPLFNNGGPTQTHALAVCSPAINAGTQVNQINDQRGAPFVRQFGAAPDIGAFEHQPNDDLILGNGFELMPTCQ